MNWDKLIVTVRKLRFTTLVAILVVFVFLLIVIRGLIATSSDFTNYSVPFDQDLIGGRKINEQIFTDLNIQPKAVDKSLLSHAVPYSNEYFSVYWGPDATLGPDPQTVYVDLFKQNSERFFLEWLSGYSFSEELRFLYI